MKTKIRGKHLLFAAMLFIVGFVLGILVVKWTGAAENQGLAGGAIVLFYGIIGAIIAFVAGLFISTSLNSSTLTKLNRILGVVALLLVIWIVYRIVTLGPGKKDPVYKDRKISAPAQDISLSSFDANRTLEDGYMGFVQIDLTAESLLFYGNLNPGKTLMEHSPTDSMVFYRTETGGYQTNYAPPWLLPAHMKLDYGVLMFRLLGVGEDYLVIESNEPEKRIAFIDRSAGNAMLWPDFWLSVNSVEWKYEKSGTPRIKPLDHASEVNAKYDFMRPIEVRGNWMLVDLLSDNFNSQGTAWIRWMSEGEISIDYNLFS